jgi:hypothetical protein
MLCCNIKYNANLSDRWCLVWADYFSFARYSYIFNSNLKFLWLWSLRILLRSLLRDVMAVWVICLPCRHYVVTLITVRRMSRYFSLIRLVCVIHVDWQLCLSQDLCFSICGLFVCRSLTVEPCLTDDRAVCWVPCRAVNTRDTLELRPWRHHIIGRQARNCQGSTVPFWIFKLQLKQCGIQAV